LRERGYDLEVVNGGCPYYTTAEIIGTLAFRGNQDHRQSRWYEEGP
jgi:hypothetical protein